MVFDGTRITWGGYSWRAVSGGGKYLAAPSGLYNIDRQRILQRQVMLEDGFNDLAAGEGFFIPITPTFDSARRGLGIHPDGGHVGIEGCIGIQDDPWAFYNRVAMAAANAKLTIQIVG
jgi:hypothetical protein